MGQLHSLVRVPEDVLVHVLLGCGQCVVGAELVCWHGVATDLRYIVSRRLRLRPVRCPPLPRPDCTGLGPAAFLNQYNSLLLLCLS